MKKMYFESLPHWESGRYKGKINWTESVGRKVDFVYGDIKGKVEILHYEITKHMLTIKYLDSQFPIHTNGFRKCCLGELLKTKTVDYKFTIGTIVNNMKLLAQKRMRRYNFTEKGYTYECLKCSYVGEMYEYQISGNVGCQVCANRIIVKGINDIATTNPEYIKYFADIDDTYKYSWGANKKVILKCPNCEYIKTMTVNTLTNMGFGCNKCSDGISYPEKFIFNLLDQLGINFETRKRFDWSKGKEYDFYIPSLDAIIETHGLQHYEESFSRLKGSKRNLIKEIASDNLKYSLAKDNGTSLYIILDCRESNQEWIKKSVTESKLNELFNLKEIDWNECDLKASSSKLAEACKLWNEGLNTISISKKLKLSQGTIIKYLHKGSKLNLCKYYNIKKPKEVAVYSLSGTMLDTFDSINQLARESEKKYGVKFSAGNISMVCQGKAKTHKGYRFQYKE